MNGASSELQGTFNDYISFAMYYEMCNRWQTVIFFCPNYSKYLGQNSIQY